MSVYLAIYRAPPVSSPVKDASFATRRSLRRNRTVEEATENDTFKNGESRMNNGDAQKKSTVLIPSQHRLVGDLSFSREFDIMVN